MSTPIRTNSKNFTVRLSVGSLLTLIITGLALAACGDSSEDAECSTREDCARDEVCRAGSCEAPSSDGACASTDECPRFNVCSNALCVPEGGTSNGTSTSNGTTSTSNGTTRTSNGTTSTSNGTTSTSNGTTSTSNGTTSTSNGTTASDRVPPVVVSTMPESGETGVALDAKVIIMFDEGVRSFGLEQKIMFQEADTLSAVPFMVDNDEATGLVELTPTAALKPGTPYQVTIDSEVTDTSGNNLADIYRWRFSTSVPEEPLYAELALKYAPVVYQEVDVNGSIGRGDYFGGVDFDNDLNAENNFETFRNVTFAAKAYYGVLETASHYFIQYLFYYPANYNNTTERHGPHDITATQVVLAKTDGGAPEFVMAESSALGEPYMGFAVEGSGISDRNQGSLDLTFPASEMWEGTHYLAYHGKHFHGSCHWSWQPSLATLAPWCRHTPGQFLATTSSLAYYPAAQGQKWTEAICSQTDVCAEDEGITCTDGVCRDGDGARAMTYGLESFFAALWSRRIALSEDVNLFGPSSAYSPHADSGDRPGRGDDRRFPSSLATESGATSRGRLPFSWTSNGSVATGQWWVDPAWSFSVRFQIADGAFAQDYCFNPYFDIDRRGEEGCAQ